MIYTAIRLVGILIAMTLASCELPATQNDRVTIYPEEYPHALRNPLKGFRPELWAKLSEQPYMTLVRHYIKWNELENSESDDLINNIQAFSRKKWARFEGTGIKVIPRVYLDWDEKVGDEYWPSDMEPGDYSSPEFKRRVVRLIEALGECWDDNPRVAWVQMGLIGYWGEHHNPHPDETLQKLLGTAFEKAFPNKPVLIRHPDEFADFEFGIYWDSWAHHKQTPQLMHGAGIERLNETTGRWKTKPMEGEVAYNWGSYQIQPGDDPDDTLRDPEHREFLIDTIRNLHCSALGWISKYDASNPASALGAEAVQRAFGYRFVLEEFAFNPTINSSGGNLEIQLAVKNTGSAPFYQDWPLTVNLLDPESLDVVWSQVIEEVDIRTWLPGEDWDETLNSYTIPASTRTVEATFTLPLYSDLPAGRYIIALSIPDPELRELGVRLAIRNYIEGDLHPLGILAYGTEAPDEFEVNSEIFSDLMAFIK